MQDCLNQPSFPHSEELSTYLFGGLHESKVKEAKGKAEGSPWSHLTQWQPGIIGTFPLESLPPTFACTSGSWAESWTEKGVHFDLGFKVWTTGKQDNNRKTGWQPSPTSITCWPTLAGLGAHLIVHRSYLSKLPFPLSSWPRCCPAEIEWFPPFSVLSSFGQDPYLIFKQK